MKIEDLVSGRMDQEEVSIDGKAIPASTLKKLMEQGYLHMRRYDRNNTFFFWGKTCSACLTIEDLRAKS